MQLTCRKSLVGWPVVLVVVATGWASLEAWPRDQAPAAPQPPGAPAPAATGRGASPFQPPEPFDYGNRAGWTSLFDGRMLTGWNGNPDVWSVDDGVITAASTTERRVGSTHIIWTGGEPADFESSSRSSSKKTFTAASRIGASWTSDAPTAPERGSSERRPRTRHLTQQSLRVPADPEVDAARPGSRLRLRPQDGWYREDRARRDVKRRGASAWPAANRAPARASLAPSGTPTRSWRSSKPRLEPGPHHRARPPADPHHQRADHGCPHRRRPGVLPASRPDRANRSCTAPGESLTSGRFG